MIADGVLQDTLKQHGILLHGLVAVFFREFHHGILNYIKCHMFVAHRVQRLLVGTTLGFGEKFGKFFVAGQFGLLCDD